MEILLSTTKSLISIVVVLLLLSVSLFITFSDSPQFHLPLPSLSYPSASCPPSTARRPLPLKVFMYDLPRRFNFDMLDQGRGANGGAVPEWSKVSGLKRQHSIEYWMTASLLVEGGEGKEAVRVSDGDEAEVFFVPFFSSLSFNTHGRNMTDPETEKDHQLQIDLLDYLNKSMYWQRSEGLDHVIPMHHPNAFRFLRDRVNASILVVVDFGRYPKYLSSLKKDVVTPYVHVVDTFNDDNAPDPFESRPTLLYFRGRTIRKDDFIRIKLAKMLKKYDEVRIEESFATGEGIKASTQGMRSSKFCLHPAGDTQHQSTQGMRSSKFCLHPAGDTPSSCRLFDAIVSHCVPVIISDHIELPFEDEIDYSQFSLFFSVHDALQPDFLVSKLREVTKERWVEMWAQLKNISHHFEFQNPPKEGDAVNMLWREVRHKVPSVRLAMHRNHRLKIPDWWDRRR